MTAAARVSVVIPAFDAAATIGTQLEALAGQTYSGDWEVIVADNGSTDATAARVEGWQSRLPGVRMVDASARRGPGAARNIGAAHATGAFLLFCDADDAADAGWVAALESALENADAAAGGRRYSALNRQPHGPMDWPDPFFAKAPLTHLAAASSHNLAVRADVFTSLGGFDETLGAGEDVDLCWRIQLSGHTLAAAPDAIMQIRRREGLVATYRQALAYGRADAMLARKYAAVPVPAEPGSRTGAGIGSPPAPEPTPGLFARLRRRGIRLPDPVYLLDRLGRRRGERLGDRPPYPAQYTADAR